MNLFTSVRSLLIEIPNGANLTGTWRAKLRNGNGFSKTMSRRLLLLWMRRSKWRLFERHSCPDDVRDHLCLNAAMLTTYNKMKDEIAGVLFAREGRSATNADSSGPLPMDIGWVGWKGKGDKCS